MKLIDLLVQELPKRGGWPEGVDTVRQNCKGQLFEINSDYCSCFKLEKCDDWITDVVTKQQYESALAASDGWIEWAGGECQVDSDAIVEVKFRNPSSYQFNNDRAGDFYWPHDGLGYDIIAYRLRQPAKSEQVRDEQLEQDLNECIGQGVDVPEWNGDGVPPVGIECEWQDKNTKQWQPVKVVYSSEWVTIVREINKEKGDDLVEVAIENYGDESRRKFRPLRTEAEKAREKLAASLHIAAGASPIELNGIGPLYFKLADAIISGSVFGTTFKAGK